MDKSKETRQILRNIFIKRINSGKTQRGYPPIYRRVTSSRVLQISAVLLIAFLLIGLAALSFGSARIDLTRVFGCLFHAMGGSQSCSPQDELILFSIRLPRIFFAAITGAALSLGGVVFQAILRNPLADPYVLGVSGGSALGAIIGTLIGAGSFYLGIPLLAFLGALITVALVFVIAGGGSGRIPDNYLLLAGVIVNAFFSAAILFFLSLADSMELHSITFWLMGDLARVSGSGIIPAAFCVLVAFVMIYSQARGLNLMVQGEETARQLGVMVEKTKYTLLIITSLATAVVVSLCGIIGFVGIIVPHMMRLLFGSDHRLLICASALFGATFLVVADTIARIIIAPAELPVGVITALLGAPYFIFLLRRKAF